MALTLKLSAHRGSIRAEIRNAGKLVARQASQFNREEHFVTIASDLSIDVPVLMAAVDRFEADPADDTTDLAAAGFTCYIRPLTHGNPVSYSAATAREAFAHAMDADELTFAEPLIYWDDDKHLACIDLDASDGHEWTDEKLITLDGIPTPLWSWVTKSGGLRLVYEATGDYYAREVAGIAYLRLLQTPYKGLEIKHDTRHPKYATPEGHCGEVFARAQSFDPSILRRYLSLYSASDREAADWLASKGMQQGGRYGHDKCPLDPQRGANGTPVYADEHGVYCHSCNALGMCYGSQRAGFFPYSALCGTKATSLVYRAMECKTHYGHAKYIVESKLGLSPKYAAIVYSAGLMLFGHDRRTVDHVFAAGADFIRMGDRWTNSNGEPYTKDVRLMLMTLPSCMIGKAMDKAQVCRFEQGHDLTAYGYPAILPIYGLRIWGHWIKDATLTAVIQNRHLAQDSNAHLRPAYRTPEQRIDRYWDRLDKYFPGVDHRYLKLIIAARGVSEAESGMPPFTVVTGPSGAGKSLTIALAAAICGDSNTEVTWDRDRAKFRQQFRDADGGLVTCNEIDKDSKAGGMQGAGTSFDFLLNMTPDSKSHSLYEGPRRMGRIPAIFVTDTQLAAAVKASDQLSRRLVHVHLPFAVQWEDPAEYAGLSHPKAFRLLSEEAAEICNAIVSEVIDEFFRTPTSYRKIATRLGYVSLTESPEAKESDDALCRLYSLACQQPDTSMPPGHWKLIERHVASALRDTWQELTLNGDFASSRRCSEADWKRVLGFPAIFDCRAKGTDAVLIRFKNRDCTKFNGECGK